MVSGRPHLTQAAARGLSSVRNPGKVAGFSEGVPRVASADSRVSDVATAGALPGGADTGLDRLTSHGRVARRMRSYASWYTTK